MMHARQQARRVAHWVAMMATAVALVMLGWFAAPALKIKARDVVREDPAHPVRWHRLPDGSVQVDDLILEKIPPSCAFVAMAWSVGAYGKPTRPADVTRPGHVNGESRPSGLQSFGAFRISNAPRGRVVVRAVWWYRCDHDVTETADELGPWTVED